MEDFSPISRLEILVKNINGQNPDHTVKGVLAGSFEIDRSNATDFYDYVLEYLRLVDTVETVLKVLISDFDSNDHYKRTFLSLKKIGFYVESKTPWKDLRLVDDSVYMLLGLGKNYYKDFNEKIENKVGDEYLVALKESLETLFDSIMNSDLPRSIRLSMCADVVNMKKSLVFYAYRGAGGIAESMSSLSGRMILHKNDINNHDSNDVLDSFKNVYNSYYALVQQANTAYQFIENIGKLVIGEK